MKKTSSNRARLDESNDVVFMTNGHTFTIEITFARRPPTISAGLTKLGIKNAWSDEIKNRAEQEETESSLTCRP